VPDGSTGFAEASMASRKARTTSRTLGTDELSWVPPSRTTARAVAGHRINGRVGRSRSGRSGLWWARTSPVHPCLSADIDRMRSTIGPGDWTGLPRRAGAMPRGESSEPRVIGMHRGQASGPGANGRRPADTHAEATRLCVSASAQGSRRGELPTVGRRGRPTADDPYQTALTQGEGESGPTGFFV